MKPFALTGVQIRNLKQSQADIDMIDAEIELAKKAGISVDPDLEKVLEECRARVYDCAKAYIPKEERKLVDHE